MAKPPFDADALITMFENATAQQSQQLRQAVAQATLTALQGREMTLKNIRSALAAVTDAAGTGLAKNPLGADVAPLLDQAVAGMDDALLKAVDANRVALQQLVAQGADLREKHLKKALDDLDRIEDTLIATVKKAAAGAATPIAGPWNEVLEKMQAGGTLSGSQASKTVEQMIEQVCRALWVSVVNLGQAQHPLAEETPQRALGRLATSRDHLQRPGRRRVDEQNGKRRWHVE